MTETVLHWFAPPVIFDLKFDRESRNKTDNNKKLISRWDSERERFYDNNFNHFYAVRPGSYRIRWNNVK